MLGLPGAVRVLFSEDIRREFMKRTAFAALAIACASIGVTSAAISTFDDLTLAPNSYWNGSANPAAGGFRSGGAAFINSYDTTYGSWENFSYSNVNNVTTPGYTNQYAAITGSGVGGLGNYGVFFVPYTPGPSIVFDAPSLVQSMQVTNTTYAALLMQSGDDYTKKFGGTSGDEADWFKLTITGTGGTGAAVEFYLADYRFSDNSQDYILKEWANVDLTALGEVTALTFTLSSSDVGEFGMNTPAYFAMDNLAFVPEPSSAVLAVIGLMPLLCRRRVA